MPSRVREGKLMRSSDCHACSQYQQPWIDRQTASAASLASVRLHVSPTMTNNGVTSTLGALFVFLTIVGKLSTRASLKLWHLSSIEVLGTHVRAKRCTVSAETQDEYFTLILCSCRQMESGQHGSASGVRLFPPP